MSYGIKASPKPASHYNRTTDEFADLLRIKSQTVRKRYCQHGSYFGIRPLRLPNGKLLWPDATLENLLVEQLVKVETDISNLSKTALFALEVDTHSSLSDRKACGVKGGEA